jgi:hypothetical protein
MQSRFQFLILTRGFSSIETSWAMTSCGATMPWARWDCALPESQAELVLSTNLDYAVNWLVTSVSQAVESIVEAGGKVILQPTRIPVGQLAIVNDPFGNALVLLDLSAGGYVTDVDGRVLGVQPRAADQP